ncbi:IclR family transcriptional regulator [Arthrobacter sp. SD76]|uniref:IclR family transcriptional regulator n=1 Tax=Arthrobacter sp. SD76 TaxID=3415007 RepID=UPI003C76027E
MQSRSSLSRSTAHRLLKRLVHAEYVEHDLVTRSYRPGRVLTEIGAALSRDAHVHETDRAVLQRLAAATKETVHLVALRATNVIFLDSVEGSQMGSAIGRVGRTLPSHATAAGKVLLAALTDAEVKAIYPVELIRGGRGHSSVPRVDFLAELELVRARGYATNDGETEPDVSAVAVPLLDRFGFARAAVSVTAPRSRASDAWMRKTALHAARITAGETLS